MRQLGAIKLLHENRSIMPVFNYRASDQNERVRHGTLQSESKVIARRTLRGQGLRVISINELKQRESGLRNVEVTNLFESKKREGISSRQNGKKLAGGNINRSNRSRKWQLFSRTRVSKAKVASFLSELSTLLTVGVPLIEALDTLIKQERSKFSTDLLRLRDALESGLTMREAMEMRPELFDELCLSLVEVGENTGRLDDSLRSLSDFKRKSLEFRDQVRNALLYPMIILCLSVGASVFLMTSVVPSLLENLSDLGKQLPWPTRILKFLSDSLLNYGWLIVTFGLLAGIALSFAIKTTRGRRFKDELILRTPVLGDLSRKQEISRVALVVATLSSSGLDILKAIEIASRTSNNLLLREALETIAERIRVGHDLGGAMERLDYFPALVSQVFVVGQKSGRLDEMLYQLSEDYDKQVTVLSNRLAVIVEPLLIVFLSVVVGFILFATILPILEAGNVL